MCDNGRGILVQLPFEIPDITLEIAEAFISTDLSAIRFYAVVTSVVEDLQFVTCGYRGYEGLYYMELLVAFEADVWIVLIICTVLLTTILHKFPGTSSGLSIAESALISVKLLLEQSDPFPESLASNQKCKLVSGTVLLMGIILSNAYKNTNVYNMIVPRKHVAYMRLTELIHDNFKIYSRSKDVNVDVLGMTSIRTLWEYRNNSAMYLKIISRDSHDMYYGFRPLKLDDSWDISHQSEVEYFSRAASASEWQDVDMNLTYFLYNKTSLMPVTKSSLYNVANQVDKYDQFDDVDLEEELYRQFLFMEMDSLQNELKKCQKSAVVLPTYVGHQVVKQLEEQGHHDVYQGLEKYYETSVVFNIRGAIPRYLVQRASYAERCGLWKRWQKLFKERYMSKNETRTEPPKKPTMDGNVVVIFLLLGAGLVISFAFVCFEVWLFNPFYCLLAKFQQLGFF